MLHANWSEGHLHLWAEDPDRLSSAPAAPEPGRTPPHPFAADPESLRTLPGLTDAASTAVRLRLPASGGKPAPSSTLARLLGLVTTTDDGEGRAPLDVLAFEAAALAIKPEHAASALLAISDQLADEAELATNGDRRYSAGATLDYFAQAARLSRYLLSQQRFVPALLQTSTGELDAQWEAWVSDEATAQRVQRLVAAMPPAARAVPDRFRHEPWAITEDFLQAITDAECRRPLLAENFAESVEDKPVTDPHVAWLRGLLTTTPHVQANPGMRAELNKRVRAWLGVLEERGASSSWRLMLRLSEPIVMGAETPDPEDPIWTLSFHLQSVDQPSLVLDASDVWLLTGDSVTVMGRRLEQPQELLLGELGRASRFYPRLEEALEESEPESLNVSTRKAYEFLREVRPILIEQGFGVEAPSWWDSPTARLGAKLRLESDENVDPFGDTGTGMTNAARAQLGLASLINYKWEIAVGDTTLSLHEFEQLASKRTPLVRINGRWVEIRPEDVHAAIRFIRENPGGKIRLAEAMRLAYASDLKTTGIPVVGLEASGWLQAFLNSESSSRQVEQLPPPKSFHGTLRPYQARGVSWMAFQETLGFGICLADDMGLGKTVQLLALIAHEREVAEEQQRLAATTETSETVASRLVGTPDAGTEESSTKSRVQGTSDDATQQTPEPATSGEAPSVPASQDISTPRALVPPTLLLVPMSVVGNWIHECRRFCPDLKVLVHHGIGRLQGLDFLNKAVDSDLVITTYALAHRDRELLGQVKWGRVVLDEAQYIKNPSAKQSQAVRSFEALKRVALTGTPVENRLTELWSIMDFLNPGYLGSPGNFRTRFAVPIERYHDKSRGEQLRGLIRPFVLRRLKSDPLVVADLPEKVESREYSYLTSEQASMYESCVKRMLNEVDEAEGMQRRGLVLAALVKLKQICDHPSLILKDFGDNPTQPADPSRSGKCIRTMEMVEELLAEGDQALIFTQFREMGHLLESMLRHKTGKDILFIHGGTTQPQRQAMIDRFQKADGTAPILLLSLRAGGVGLNLTAATHVFHFDRWWNPAVENQATDRAYRIGQTRTVQVHKFVIRGTLEERIDQMIESKTELAENIIGSGEQWLSELNTDQLRDILTLRNDAVDDEV
ncbi:MAG TPA: DEAD/DEAH box helicase [Phycisphaerales bacterium]|nr:DEAD/DEAH box helicase [Phycisphaerales bacterium]